MKSLNKIIIRNLKLNKKRTIGTIIGIMLSVALICAVSCMVATLQNTLIQSTISNTGYYHFSLSNVDQTQIKKLKNNRDIKHIYEISEIGTAIIPSTDTNTEYGFIYSMDQKTFKDLKFLLKSGRYPKNDKEKKTNYMER